MHNLDDVNRLDAIRVLAEPHRLAILRLLLARPHTISMLGARLGKHPAWVRHHMKALEAVDLVKLAEIRTTRNYTEKFYTGTAAAFTVSLLVRPEPGPDSPLIAMVSHDMAVEALADDPDDPHPLATMVTGSLDSLIGVRQGLADIAGCHLLDSDTGQYNAPYARHIFPDREVILVTVAHREQGLIVPPANPRRISTIADIAGGRLRLANRNRGSGTRLWIDQALAELGADPSEIPGYETSYQTHTGVAEAVARGDADVALGVEAVAERLGLGFVPLFRERYDLVMPVEVYQREETVRLIERLHSSAFRHTVSRIPGYESGATGDELRLAV
jgi:putative molybdopterin biosynthesis protein